MKIELSFHRNRPKVGGGVDVVNYDKAFQQKLEVFLEQEMRDNPDMNYRDSAYADLRECHTGLVRAIERILPKESEKPFQIVIDVTGEIDNSPGPRLY